MELEVTQIPTSNILLIPVASQNMTTEFPSEIGKIKHGNDYYRVHEWFLYEKGEHFPKALFLLALGVAVTPEMIWNKYKESNSIILFVCSKVKEEIKQETNEIIPTLE